MYALGERRLLARHRHAGRLPPGQRRSARRHAGPGRPRPGPRGVASGCGPSAHPWSRRGPSRSSLLGARRRGRRRRHVVEQRPRRRQRWSSGARGRGLGAPARGPGGGRGRVSGSILGHGAWSPRDADLGRVTVVGDDVVVGAGSSLTDARVPAERRRDRAADGSGGRHAGDGDRRGRLHRLQPRGPPAGRGPRRRRRRRPVDGLARPTSPTPGPARPRPHLPSARHPLRRAGRGHGPPPARGGLPPRRPGRRAGVGAAPRVRRRGQHPRHPARARGGPRRGHGRGWSSPPAAAPSTASAIPPSSP